jgi:hypothetical protein
MSARAESFEPVLLRELELGPDNHEVGLRVNALHCGGEPSGQRSVG